MSIPMADKSLFCPYCSKHTWAKVTEEKREEIGGYLIRTAISDIKCETCGRQIKFVEVFGIEMDKPLATKGE